MTLTSHRVEKVRVELLTNTDASLGDLDGVAGGNLQWDANADIPAGGQLELVDLGQEINYSLNRVRAWWQVLGEEEWALGVYVLAAPAVDYSGSGITRSITLLDKLTVIKENVLTKTLQVAAGANIINAVATQIAATGETRVAVTASTATLTNPMTWDPGTSRLQVINDLLTAAGYATLWTDRMGMFRVEPYVNPEDRPVVWEFAEGESAIHSPTWQYELSLWEASNTVVMTSQATEGGSVYLASAVDENPDSPTSTVSMGRVLNPIVVENVEASSLADLQSQATRMLLANSNVAGKLRVSHASVPIWFNDAVQFTSQGVDARAAVTRMSVELRPGALMQSEWRQTL